MGRLARDQFFSLVALMIGLPQSIGVTGCSLEEHSKFLTMGSRLFLIQDDEGGIKTLDELAHTSRSGGFRSRCRVLVVIW